MNDTSIYSIVLIATSKKFVKISMPMVLAMITLHCMSETHEVMVTMAKHGEAQTFKYRNAFRNPCIPTLDELPRADYKVEISQTLSVFWESALNFSWRIFPQIFRGFLGHSHNGNQISCNSTTR